MIWEALELEEHELNDLQKLTLGPLGKAQGYLQGVQIQPGDIAERCYDEGWKDGFNLHTMTATILSESQGYDRAYNDNLLLLPDLSVNQKVRNVETLELYTVVDPAKGIMRYEDGTTDTFPLTVHFITSRDVGTCQINIPASKIGTPDEEALYDWEYNITRARALYDSPSSDEDGIRGFAPWYGWVLRVYLRDTYQKRAGRGVGNFFINKSFRFPTDMLGGVPYEHKLQLPVLDYRYRLQGMQQQFDVVVAKSRQLKPIGGPLVDAKSDEIIKAAVLGKQWGSK